MKVNSSPHTSVAPTKPSVDQPLSGSLEYSNTYTATQNVIGVKGQCPDAVDDSATPPGITQGLHLIHHPRSTARVPDLEKMRFTEPTEWLEELRNPSLVLAVPHQFVAPRPAHARVIARETFSAIVDQEWEYCEGNVRHDTQKARQRSLRHRTLASWRDFIQRAFRLHTNKVAAGLRAEPSIDLRGQLLNYRLAAVATKP